MRALIVHHGFMSRNAIKRILEHAEEREFDEINIATLLAEGLERLREHRDFCWVFVGANYDRSALADFMEQACREAPQAQFVALPRESEADHNAASTTIANPSEEAAADGSSHRLETSS